MNEKKIAALIKELLKEIGEDPQRAGLQKTPQRYAHALKFLTSGYQQKSKAVINNAIFASPSTDMIICRDIEIYSLCEHHLLPFYGKCHIGYLPHKKLLGVSKLARIVNCFSRRLQIQERLTAQIADDIKDAIDAQGVGVVLECRHLCMMMRGVEKQNSIMTTSTMLGFFRSKLSTRTEFLSLLK